MRQNYLFVFVVSASPVSSQRIRKRSCSVGSKLDEALKQDVLVSTLKRKEEDAKLAAEIGQNLLQQNVKLTQEIKKLKEVNQSSTV